MAAAACRMSAQRPIAARGHSSARVHVRVYSDVACPWCYVGKRRLDRAIDTWSMRPEAAPVDVQWLPFMIDKRTQPEGEEYMAYNVRRWGSDGWTRELRRSGRQHGAEFQDWKVWPNTFKAHQLVRLAEDTGGVGKGAEAKEALFVHTYERGGNVSLDSELTDVGVSVGLPRECVMEALAGAKYAQEVQALDAAAKRELKISGVPFFIITSENGHGKGSGGDDGPKSYALSGAQLPERLLQFFEA